MEIKENVNPGTQKGEFSKIPFEYRKNMQCQIVVYHSRHIYSGESATGIEVYDRHRYYDEKLSRPVFLDRLKGLVGRLKGIVCFP